MSKRILVVDDQEIERTALKTILSARADWVVSEATDGLQALDQLCTSVHPQLCIVDLNMPNAGGLEFLRRIRRDPDLRGLKVMIMSSARDRSTIIELAKLGIEGYLLKPFEPGKTLSVIAPVMDALPDPDGAAATVRDLLTKIALIAEDDPVARTALAAMITVEPHWTVVEASDGRAALEKLRAGLQPNICFLDLKMPEMGGVELLSEIRKDPKLEALRVAVTSGERDAGTIRTLATMRIDAYLLKPLDGAKVRAALRAVS